MTEQNITRIAPDDSPWTTSGQQPRKHLPLITTHDGPFNDRIQIKSTQGSTKAAGWSGYYVTIETAGGETLVFTAAEAKEIAESLTRAAQETELNERLDTLCPFHDDQSLALVKGEACTCDS